MNKPTFFQELPDFSLVLGGPLYQLFRRSHLAGDALELLHRRILFIPLFAWLPLLILSLIGGHAMGGGIQIPFLHDIEAQVRFLVALSLLIAAEMIVHLRVRPAHTPREEFEFPSGDSWQDPGPFRIQLLFPHS